MATRKSGIPVKSSNGPKIQTGATQSGLNQARPSSIPVKKTKNDAIIKSASPGAPTNSPKQRDFQEEIKRLESEVKDKDSAINDVNEKLMKRMNECQVLREENAAARESLHLSTDREVSGKLKDLENLVTEKETFIENMLTNKHELERKFEVELDMMKNQHEIELLSLEQRLEDAHQEKMDELQTNLNNEKQVSGGLREEMKKINKQGASAEINTLHEELMSTKLRYENQIYDLKQEMELVKSENEDFVAKQEEDRKEIDGIKEKQKEEVETLKYLVQEKDILINDLKNNLESGDTKSQGIELYAEEDVTRKLDELRRELTTEHEHNLELANQLWRKKFEEHQSTDSDRTRKQGDQGTHHENTEKLLDEISDLKEQLQEANEEQEEQNEILEVQEKEMEELRESKKEFEERYNALYKETETKWQNEFSESEIIEKIKSHYEMEIERLHGELEDIQNDNSNLKTELDLMANDVGGGHSKVGGPVRRPSVTARLDMKAEIEDYKVQLATLERDLQHALNQNERLKLENNVKSGGLADSKLEEISTFSSKVDELQAEREKLTAEKDDFRAKFEESKKERKKLERDFRTRDEERTKLSEELQAKTDEIALLKEESEAGIKTSEAKILKMKENVGELTSKCERADSKLVSMKENLTKSENRERDLKEIVQELKDKEVTLTQEFEEAKSKMLTLEEELSKMKLEQNGAKEKMNKVKDSEGRQVVEARKRVTELENMLAQGKVANEALKVKYEKLLSGNETKTSRIAELTEALSQVKTEFENSEVKYERVSKENDSIRGGEVQLERRNEEYDSLTKKYEGRIRENEAMSVKISEVESLLQQKHVEYETLSANYSELRQQNKSRESRLASLEADLNEQKLQVGEVESLNNNLKNENAVLESKVSEVENLLKQSKDECVKLKRNNENVSVESGKKTTGVKDSEAALNKSKMDYEKLSESYQNVLEESSVKVSKIEKQEKEGTQFRKQITAFEKKVARQEREKKGLEEKAGSLNKVIEEQKKEILSLKEKCESCDWKNTELETKLEAMRNTEDRLKTYTERNQELLSVVEEATREKKDLLAKKAHLMKENKELMDERDTLKNERGVYESEREQDSSEHERKLETAQKKLKEKDRVLNETKKHCRQLKENEKELREKVSEKEERCLELEGKAEELNKKLKYLSKEEDVNETRKQNRDLEESFEEQDKQSLDLEGRLEQLNKENARLKQQLEEMMNVNSENEQASKDEIARQKNNFTRELKSVQENIEQSAQIEILRLTQENNENEEMRKEMTRVSEENHTLKIKLDDLGIEVSQEKEEKYKVEKLKDQFRFEVQRLQERLDAEQEKMSVLQNERLQGEERINEERSKLLATLNEYESKNTKLISNIDKASSALKTTKEKYVKLKEKFNTLAKKYTKLNQEKLNKSDVQVGPDTSVDLSLVVEDLQRSKETAEETNLKLRVELDRLREEIGRSEYQVKAARKANVVLMKQSRCLYHESEEHKRLDDERTQELQKYRQMKESLQQEKETLQKERELLEELVAKHTEETARLKRENDEYFLARNRTEIELGEKASECVLHSRQLEKLKNENEFLYQQGRKLQAEVDVARMKPMTRVTSKPDENQYFFHSFDKDLRTSGERLADTGTIKDFGTGRLSQGSKLSESTNSFSFDEARNFIPPVFNNEKIIGDKVIESPNKNTVKSSPPSKDTNVQISRNIINNEFPTEKYLGKTYWDTLEFLKKK